MDAPRTYADWLPLLDEFRQGNDSVIEPLSRGSIEWTNVVAERWVAQVGECLSARLRQLSSQLQLALDRSAGDRFAVETALLGTRRRLDPLRQFCAMPALPEDVREHFASQLANWADQTQKSLEAQAVAIRNDEGRLLKLFRDHPLTKPKAAPVGDHAPAVEPGNRARTIIF